MVRTRPSSSCEIECELCIGDRYIDTYNDKLNCKICKNCLKPNMEYRLHCNATHNAVCTCKANYRCKDQSCEQCVPIPSTTTKSTFPPSTPVLKPGALTTVRTPSQPIRDTVWFVVIITLLCAGITIAVVTKIKPFMFWIKSKHGYRLARDSPSVPSGSEEVSTPVQEVLGKCEMKLSLQGSEIHLQFAKARDGSTLRDGCWEKMWETIAGSCFSSSSLLTSSVIFPHSIVGPTWPVN
ncbi:uncharacterized protein cd27 isoform X1 [Pseudoliparis swirei]|uniref:uncharacterized protein cd27 isoform X1 n=2 Tax=Pseudoliparis swirei TaxID=2059687 RepID=UPI0024BEDE7B|nr:uncharacterized protein cd27 isoform X1 [Pseudoliparis swirei]